MKKSIFIVICILPLFLSAQNLCQTVKGKIVDKESKIPLFGANVMVLISDSIIGTTSSIDGNFRILVPIGRRCFKITYVGYEDFVLPNVLVSTGKDLEIVIEMREKFSTLKEVVVVGNVEKDAAINSMASISARQLRTEDAGRYAGGFYDPARMVSSFAGVGATEGDGSNQIVIRGNSPRGLLWRLEGIEIPNPNHFPDGQGDAGGAFCILSSTVLNNFDFYTSAFPAEYGNAYSGILDIGLRKGNSDKREYSVIVGVVGTQLSLEGPFKKGYQGSYLISYRYSNFGLLHKAKLLGLAENHLPPLFQDVNFNFYFPSKKAGNFYLFGSGGNSWTGWDAYEDSTLWNSWDDRKDDREDHWMGVIGLKYIYNFKNNKTYIKSVLAMTHQRDELSTTFVMDDLHKQNGWLSDFSYNALRSNVLIHHKFNARHSIRAGFMLNFLNSNMFYRTYDWDNQLYNIHVDKKDNTNLSQAYLQWKYRITEKLEVNTGIHSMFFALNKDYSFEPRFGMKWNASKHQSFSAGFGMHTRTENIPAYFAEVSNEKGQKGEYNRNMTFTKSIHSVLGYDLSFRKNMRLKLEVYYQYIYDVPVVDTINSSMSALNFSYGIPEVVMKNKGIGKNYGIELTLEKFYSNNYYFLITTSLFESKYLANNDQWYNTVYNNNHITNFLIGKDFKVGKNKQNILGLNLKTLIRGGFRYTPIDLQKSAEADEEIYLMNETFEKQFPLYHRFDLGINFQKNNKKWKWEVSLNMYNMLNTKNVMAYRLKHNEKTNAYSIAAVEGLGIVPNLNFKIDF